MKRHTAIAANIYKPKYGDASNDGISSKFDEILVACPQGVNGPCEYDPDDPPENLMRFETDTLGGRTQLRLVPVRRPDPPKVIGPMFGGTYAATFGSCWHRCIDLLTNDCPVLITAVPIHDRYETAEQNELLSR